MNVQSIDPRTGRLVREYRSSSPSEVREALSKARKAQRVWYDSTTKEERIDLITNLDTVCRKHIDDTVDLMYSEVGIPKKALAAAYRSVLSGVGHYVDEYRSSADREYPLDEKSWPAMKARIELVPHGVLGHIGVWNFPFWQTMITAIPALLTGNAIVFKPSELATMTGLGIVDMVHEAGFPEDVYVPVIGGPEVGRDIVRSDLDALVFTGGVETGNDIAKNAGVRPMILELGGNDPAIVCEDANIEQAARGIAYGTFSRGGQVCIRIKRVYVHMDVADELIERLTKIASDLNIEEDVGPMIREEARAKVDKTVTDAIARGAKLLHGGHVVKGPGFFYEPTVLVHDDDNLDIVRKETFGPVCPIRTVRNVEEAVMYANGTRYGLGASIWTKNVENGERIARRLDAGNVWINECSRTLPGGEYFQGWKQSGIASSQSRLQMFQKKRTVIANRSCEPRAHWFG